MAQLIVFAGHSGAGKTTLSKMAVPLLHRRTNEMFFLLDKDTVYGDYSARMMKLLTGDPNDRDSPTFLQNLREPEYNGLLAITRENLSLGVNVVLCAPFSAEIKSHQLFQPARVGLPAHVRISVVWVHVNEAEARRRIVDRGEARDRYKLSHWDQYRERRFEPTAADYPELLIYDNSKFDQKQFTTLIDALVVR